MVNVGDVLSSATFQTAVSAGLPSGAAAYWGFRMAVRDVFRRLAKIEDAQEEMGKSIAVLDERTRRRSSR